jgi:acetate kinase
MMAHLSSDACLCAVMNGWRIDTTVGFTALDEWPMGTRCGMGCIFGPDSRVPVWMIAADEERVIVKHKIDVLGLDPGSPPTRADGAIM